MMFKVGVWFLVVATLAIVAACSTPTPTLSGPIITLPHGVSEPTATTPSQPGGTVSQGSTQPGTPVGSVGAVLTVENRGGDAFNVVIAGNVVATVNCGQTVILAPGQGNVPALPWDLTVVRVSDNSAIVASHVLRLPQWLVRRPGFQPTLDYSEADGTFAPCAS